MNIADKRFRRAVKSKRKRKRRIGENQRAWENTLAALEYDSSYKNILLKWMPKNISYLLFDCEKSEFAIDKVVSEVPENNGIFLVPKEFSIIDHPKESYSFIRHIIGGIILQKYESIKMDYSECVRVDLETQVLMDIILLDLIEFLKACSRFKKTKLRVNNISGIHVRDRDVQKLLFSVGSPTIHSNKTIRFPDIIPYSLCIHDREMYGSSEEISKQKDIDTTRLVDYVLDCLKRLNRTLTPERKDDLCTVIGEILINAEEHSTTKYRFSIGYFHEYYSNGKHYGVFKLTIMNFGKTIYEKFKDPDCPNRVIVQKMKNLSEKYTHRSLFRWKKFEEETLWTLYALQEGVTSVAPDKYVIRGNGSIQFIESFFNIKGIRLEEDNFSRMVIMSGNTSITFDGTYEITTGSVDNQPYKFMTFNKSGNIEDQPDANFVTFVDHYFPGTLISAKIMFTDDDLSQTN